MRRPAAFSVAMLAMFFSAAAPGAPPLPPSRPAGLTAPAPRAERETQQSRPRQGARRPDAVAIVLPEPPPVPPPAMATDAEICLAALRQASHIFSSAEQPRAASGCGIDAPVRLEALAAANGARIALPDRPLLSCAFARSFAAFATDLLAPLGEAHLGAAPTAISTGPGFECRGRNRARDGKPSAHGRGLAIDIAAIRLADGRSLSIETPRDARERRFLATARTAACGWFTTILGPGSDAAHANHWHLDLERHGSSERTRLCQ